VSLNKFGKPYVVPNGMPLSVFNDRYARYTADGVLQGFTERAREMVIGNTSLDPNVSQHEIDDFTDCAVAGLTPLSGRHLQHGDDTQKNRNIEVFTNCSTTPFSFLKFYLLLNGSGVGRDYSSESCRVDWEYMPNVRLVLSGGSDDDGDVAKGAHPDFNSAYNEFTSCFESLKEAEHKYDPESEDVRWIKVKDSREGWAEVIAILETATFHRNHRDTLFVFDFSGVRAKGAAIKGMQNRPAQGPLPLMRAIARITTIKGAKMKPWKQALFIDHYLAACVVMGNVRRAARIATKWWKDRDIIEFIDVKRGGFLWSANNSILVDAEFWAQAASPHPSHARRVFEAAVGAAYYDKTGEPGFINVDLLNGNRDGFEEVNSANYLNHHHNLSLHRRTFEMIENILSVLKNSKYPFIVNPCSEIVLSKIGGYCLIGDVVLKYATSLEAAERAVELTARALIRTNTMPALYQSEVHRTNRIGVGLTGIFEYAWQHFELSFSRLIGVYDHVFNNAPCLDDQCMVFWKHIDHLRQVVEKTATEYSKQLGMNTPHTFTTIKPSGTISKVMACTEGAHLPPFLFYVRWVICEKDSVKHRDYVARGYPVKDVSHKYHNCVVVGFPTKHPIVDIIPVEHLLTASDVSMEDQFKWIKLIEQFWFGGPRRNNQVSYTLKYNNKDVSLDEYASMILKWQPQVRCCAVMPFVEDSAYAYLPEEEINGEVYAQLMKQINNAVKLEEYSEDDLNCPNGACPIEAKVN
jgi:ribonucleoside-triphosphate reductase (formate)